MSSFDPSSIDALLPIAVTYLLHSTLIIGCVWILTLRTGARMRDWLWKAALVMPIVTTVGHGLSIQPMAAPSWQLPITPLFMDPGLRSSSLSEPEPESRVPEGSSERASKGALAGAAPLPVDPQAAPFNASPKSGPFPWIPLALALIAAALVAWTVILPSIRLRRFLRGARVLPEGPAAAELARLRRMAGLLRPVTLYQHNDLGSPVAAGLLRCGIFVPPRVDELDPASRQALFAHELAHHARLDPLWNRIIHAITALLFFQPLNRFARARSMECSELLADDLAVRWTDDGPGLAQCLTEVAAWVRPRTAATTLHSMVGTQRTTVLHARVVRALNSPREVSALASIPAALAIAAAAWLAMPSISLASLPADEVTALRRSNPYLVALHRLSLQLDLLDPDSDGYRALRDELEELTKLVTKKN